MTGNKAMHDSGLIIEKIVHESADRAGVNLYMARADKIHPLASGNKFYKLKPQIEYAKANNIKQFVSFGGAFSNHIYALALTANDNGLQSIGIIRGESEYANNPTLTAARKAGMKLEFVNRKTYQRRNDENYLAELQKCYPEALIIPEGGSNQLAISGCAELAKDINAQQHSDILTIASGTGASFSGLVCGLEESQQGIAYAVLKDASLTERIVSFIQKEGVNTKRYVIEQADYGGYAKFDEAHLAFILDWLDKTGILLDPIYTSKMCRRLTEQLSSGYFKQDTSITMIHSGGLQGWLGMQAKVIKLAGESAWERIQSQLM